jgi:hypothetical protein
MIAGDRTLNHRHTGHDHHAIGKQPASRPRSDTPGISVGRTCACSHRSGLGLARPAAEAKALALTGADLFASPQLVADAHKEFARQLPGKSYRSFIPEGAKPPLDYHR